MHPHSSAVRAFFDEFVEAFRTFDGTEISRRYLTPYVSMHADGTSTLFSSNTAIAEYFQKVVDEYHEQECRSCRYQELAVTPMGTNAALGTVTWELLRENGTIVTSWRESYGVVHSQGKLKAFVSIDHAS
jgi:hypothetical protein